MKNSLESLHSSFDLTIESANLKIDQQIHTEKQMKKQRKNKSLSVKYGNGKQTHKCVTRVTEREERKRAEKYLKK